MEKTRKAISRILALVAVIAAFVAVYVVVGAAMPDDDRDDRNNPGRQGNNGGQNQQNGNGNGNGQPANPDTPKFYEVESGDTLGQISARYGVRIQEIRRLNPDLDPQTLTIGQRIRLRQ